MFFNSNLEYLTKYKRPNQNQLATQLNVSRQSIQGYIKQGKQPKYELLIKICKIYNISIDEMLTIDLSTKVKGE